MPVQQLASLELLSNEEFLVKVVFLFVGSFLIGLGISSIGKHSPRTWEFWENPLYGLIWTYIVIMVLVVGAPWENVETNTILTFWGVGVFGFPYVFTKIIDKIKEKEI